jgi:glycine C-acetyltransferase
MPTNRLTPILEARVDELRTSGRLKGAEAVTVGILAPANGKGPRFLIEGGGERGYLRMNSNSYLGLSLNARVLAAEEEAVRRYGTGPGAVRFISGTWAPHVALEGRLAKFHGREAGMLFSSAYATVMGVLPQLITDKTAVISDALNHSCIINAIALARPADRRIYRHLDLDELERHLAAVAKTCTRAVVVTDGVFSMRGDHAPLDAIQKLIAEFDALFPENIILVVDDSHGVGGFGRTGRGTEEVTGSRPVDVLIGTLGKAFGLNGGYVVASNAIVGYLRETSPFYIYSNPITPGEAEAALVAVDHVDGPEGLAALDDGGLPLGPDPARLGDARRRASGGAADGARQCANGASRRSSAVEGHSRDGAQLPRGSQGRGGDPLPDLGRSHRARHRRGARRAGAFQSIEKARP